MATLGFYQRAGANNVVERIETVTGNSNKVAKFLQNYKLCEFYNNGREVSEFDGEIR